ncbi:MAG: hypothetical protein IPJ90_14180 [Anaerolineaceae bacterium]|nr:hypothetical protein [Anaerolineaceae bacterium]
MCAQRGQHGDDPVAEMLLYSASRAQHGELIRPSLATGHIVLCDRFADSTIAYQGYGRGLDLAQLHQVTHIATGGLKPDLTFLLDIDVEVGLARRTGGGLEMNRLDLKPSSFTGGYGRVITFWLQQIRCDG